MVGSSTDGLGIIGEIKKTCGEHPSLPLGKATQIVYLTLRYREQPKP
jgi:hypothetical protein